MRKFYFRKRKSLRLLVLIIVLGLMLSSCLAKEMREYYEVKENYVLAEGTVFYIKYNEDVPGLYIGFQKLEPEFSGRTFRIEGNNLSIVLENGIMEKLKMGDRVQFVSAPMYFGDGYIMPIVAIWIDGEELLGFEDGYQNLMKWLEE